MKMVPFYDMYGTILGHVNVDMCGKTRNSVVVDNGPHSWSSLSMLTPEESETLSPVEMFHLRYRKIEFCCHNHSDQTIYHLVVEAHTIPSWFWKAKAVVEFFPHPWREVR